MENINPSITDWITAWSSLAATLVAIVMAILAYQQYLTSPKQEDEPQEANDLEAEERLTEALIFKTSKQKTRLRITNGTIECHLEDIRSNKGGHQWTLSQSQVKAILDNSDYHVNPGFKSKSGVFSLGPRKNWLYSKTLFPEPEYLHGVLTELLRNTLVSD